MGELHLEIIVDRLKREFSVEATVGKPQVAYKETLTRPADGEMKYAKQTGGRGQYGHAKINFPGEPGTGYIFENEIVGGADPEGVHQAVDEGIQEALTRGVLAGYPIDDVRVELYDGSSTTSTRRRWRSRSPDRWRSRTRRRRPGRCCSSRSCASR